MVHHYPLLVTNPAAALSISAPDPSSRASIEVINPAAALWISALNIDR